MSTFEVILAIGVVVSNIAIWCLIDAIKVLRAENRELYSMINDKVIKVVVEEIKHETT